MEGNKLWVVHYTKTVNDETISVVHGVYEEYHDANAAMFYLRCKNMNTCHAEISEVIVE